MGDTDLPSDAVPVTTLRINEVYDRPTVQGEGPHVGRSCTFVRLWGCNLHCRWCDTPFTWDIEGRNGTPYPRQGNVTDMPIADVVDRVLAVGVPICVVSGGEPMLQARAVNDLAWSLSDHSVETHVETNGTRPPPPLDFDAVIHYSVSPKLPSAEAGPYALMLPALHAWAEHPRAIFKVVCSTASEVHDAYALFNTLGVRNDARWIMPEGINEHQLDASLQHIIDAAMYYRLNVSPRLHVTLWGNERGR